MKITITESVSREIELPLYFMSNKYPQCSYMLVGDKSAIEVTDHEISESLVLFPKIQVVAIDQFSSHIFSQGIKHLSETEFKLKFTEVTNRIESLLN